MWWICGRVLGGWSVTGFWAAEGVILGAGQLDLCSLGAGGSTSS